MNCEKCKNKRATLFYADDAGVRHSLCAACGASVNKLTRFTSAEPQGEEYCPTLPLSVQLEMSKPRPYAVPSGEVFCKGCGMELKRVTESGEMGCPVCIDTFARYLFLSPSTPHRGSRMPLRVRLKHDRAAELSRLCSEIAAAVQAEDYERAAQLRDRKRAFESECACPEEV